jgi:predicted negative regulator of RcsB-dependent stress response
MTPPKRIMAMVAGALAALIVVVVVSVGLWAGFKTVQRANKRADAHNAVRVQNTLIAATRAEAKRRYEESVGIRRAQDQIASTLTPLYIQHEAIQKLPNARAVYVPSGEQGIPQVYDVSDRQEDDQ